MNDPYATPTQSVVTSNKRGRSPEKVLSVLKMSKVAGPDAITPIVLKQVC